MESARVGTDDEPLLDSGGRRDEGDPDDETGKRKERSCGARTEKCAATCCNCWRRLLESMVEGGAFGEGRRAKGAEACARLTMLALWLVVIIGIGAILVTYLQSGRLDLKMQLIQYRFLEAPSVVLCPFSKNPGFENLDDATIMVNIEHEETEQSQDIGSPPRRLCTFEDRSCVCIELFPHNPGFDYAEDPFGVDASSTSQQQQQSGGYSSSWTKKGPFFFTPGRNSLEVSTDLRVGGPVKAMKVGFFTQHTQLNSNMNRISWTLAPLGNVLLANLRLHRLKTPDFDVFDNRRNVIDKIKHAYEEETSFSVFASTAPLGLSSSGSAEGRDLSADTNTHIRARYLSFLVEESIKPKTSHSLLAIALLVVACLSMLNILSLFNILFPIDQDQPRRSVAGFLKVLLCFSVGESWTHKNERSPRGGGSGSPSRGRGRQWEEEEALEEETAAGGMQSSSSRRQGGGEGPKASASASATASQRADGSSAAVRAAGAAVRGANRAAPTERGTGVRDGGEGGGSYPSFRSGSRGPSGV
uniref:Uncharacterized protein n=1 Tax=Chromera velia CCMP2878 TaxID=1169474 RepID=A0A0G4HL48_9ALVE|eukprot:Cvel_7304.t1-p1 / transcript=Cvel_7304.t1 / gene=Cvel_7304 / organism=Chromera_velia_CCMP2878 / gene_product=hypothetical protein / transcript_product=hypothetical protein / location=Cvel_scaffold378:17226-22265(+) / protein_length=529 / sequence_SO=supercontig / SO=protein_coding / is_pseudo=false